MPLTLLAVPRYHGERRRAELVDVARPAQRARRRARAARLQPSRRVARRTARSTACAAASTPAAKASSGRSSERRGGAPHRGRHRLVRASTAGRCRLRRAGLAARPGRLGRRWRGSASSTPRPCASCCTCRAARRHSQSVVYSTSSAWRRQQLARSGTRRSARLRARQPAAAPRAASARRRLRAGVRRSWQRVLERALRDRERVDGGRLHAPRPAARRPWCRAQRRRDAVAVDDGASSATAATARCAGAAQSRLKLTARWSAPIRRADDDVARIVQAEDDARGGDQQRERPDDERRAPGSTRSGSG